MIVRQHWLGVRLGLLAFVLITLAPLLSQLRAEPRDLAWLSELACHEGVSVARSTGPAGPVLQVDACGYCSLLSHCPTLAGSGWFRLANVVSIRPEDVRQPALPTAPQHFPRARPRAPPVPA